MNRIFRSIGSVVESHPFKVLLITLLTFGILLGTGIPKVEMATGNETMVQKDNEVFLSNQKMESTFGGDSILVLFTEETGENLLSLENIEKMRNVEKKFQYEDKIFSFISPASIVHQMADTQSAQLKKQILTLKDGLGDMSSKMIEIGRELNAKEMLDPSKVEEKLENLSNSTQAFSQLIEGQNNLIKASKQLQGGLATTADGLGQISNQLRQLSNLAGPNQELKMKLNVIAENIQKSVQGIETIGKNTGKIQEGAQNTSKALENMNNKLTAETSSMKKEFKNVDSMDPEQLKEMAERFITMGENLAQISDALEMFHEKSGMMVADIPKTQEELDTILYDEEGKLRSMFSDVVIDDKNSLMVIKLQGNLEDEEKAEIAQEVSTAMDEEEFENLSYVVSGKPILDSSLKSEMKSNMVTMVGMAVIIMLIVLTITFKVRWRMLSLGVILVSVIATIGLMSLLEVPITMVSMAVFPILIGLGIDYSIQFHNRYEEEKSVQRTIGQIGKAVAVAVLATVLGFVSLYASPVPMIQDFGKMLTIGVIIAFIGAIFILMSILHLRDTTVNNGKEIKLAGKNDISKESLLDRILTLTIKGVIRLSIPILVIVIALSALGFAVDGKVGVETDIESFMPQDMEALMDIRKIRDVKGSTDQIAIYMKDDEILNKENIDWIQSKTKELEDTYGDIIVDVKSIDTLIENLSSEEKLTLEEYVDRVDSLPEQQANMFINEDKTESVILLNIQHLDTEELRDFVANLKEDTKDAPMKMDITGKSVLDVEMVKGLTSGRIQMTLIGLALVFVSLLIIYRNLFKAFIPIFPVVLIVGMSSGVMYLLGIQFTPITSTLGALVLGMGTEMTVMLLERYLEERRTGKDKSESMIIAVTMIGKAIVASGLTTVGGFSVLMASEFVILKDFGLMTVINISLALLSTFIVLPPVILLFDRFLLSKKEREQLAQ